MVTGDVNKFRFFSDITGSFAMSEQFDPRYLEWQKRMKEEGFQVVLGLLGLSPEKTLCVWVLVVML